ncbi:glycosyl hydrolase [Paenibacillus polymyxa]|uniref:glycosyl hydrolase n=2 Tax=Paenibacillus TaxID=44249 RepID=UPI000D97869F|nr:glycosyl hydrolase [Paenibacillus polymyxa]MDU8671295.1 glycosyl hydrolase [Paenibacillus polymyxa]MDU8696205.1 glycosyl hydrolase [Paenibacillus polymyxa]URJ69947.1 glycosyl hydrolase [Paenibacillus polymyxa]WDZ62152.1 glycosyl hydrolase [Paenibacillus polymyxa]WEC94928.1 glycosyl hydrolase [Paenibacillus polymyxa]
MKKLDEVLENKESNYIMPFFWQHGEEEGILREYMKKINESGIKAVCVESRPHPDFLGPKWWEDMDVIMDEARKRDMKVWIVDDSHFPTGYANGRIKKEYPNLQKLFLKIHQQDFAGPYKDAGIIVKWAANGSRDAVMSVGVEKSKKETSKFNLEDKIIGVIAAKIINSDEIDPDTLCDISDNLMNGVVYFDIPEGDWRIFTIVQTFNGGEKSTEGYLNPIDPRGTQVLIDTVYEAHLNRYKEDFGTTIAGFFSDEPRFGNVKGPNASIGRFDMVLPWREDLVEILQKNISEDVVKYLPLLWVNGKSKENKIRYLYMDIITKLYSENFTQRLGKWCRAHNVEYIGHVIEDNNAHARLGYGAGHFYRSLWEQDMSGLDVVLHQILPGMDKGYFKSCTSSGWDGEFFHYALAKMGASLGHMDEKKKGRTMCEVFGAYGWGEGLKLMKWITDHMLVRGVNYFVPHAFSPKEFPDLDCPPHFYAHGKNPQFRYMKILNDYTNKISHLLTDGIHVAPVAVLYHGEAEWSGEYMLLQKPAKELMQNQIDFDIVPTDILMSSEIKDKKLIINNESFSGLVVPYSESLPKKLIEKLLVYLEAGFKVYFIDDLPKGSSEGINIDKELRKLQEVENCKVIGLDNLVTDLKNSDIYDIQVYDQQPYLRYYHYTHQDGDVFMFFNEHPYHSINTVVEVPLYLDAYIYDAFENKVLNLNLERTQKGSKFKLNLEKYESKIIIFSKNITANIESIITDNEQIDIQEISGEWKISLSTSEKYPDFETTTVIDKLVNLAAPNLYPDFSGTVRYEIDFNVSENFENAFIFIKDAYEIVNIFMNGCHVGSKICPPYNFEVSNCLRTGSNNLVIEVTNTLEKEQKDFFSQYLIHEPTGITGSVNLVLY